MGVIRYAIAAICGGFLVLLPASGSNLVTGNGFGFAVVSPETATVTRFYAHPYSFVRPDPRNPLSEGIQAASFIKALGWSGPAAHSFATEYEEDSHVIHVHNS